VILFGHLTGYWHPSRAYLDRVAGDGAVISKSRPLKSSLERRFSFSAIAFRIMGRLRTGGNKIDHHD
jgi:hypothetical protein